MPPLRARKVDILDIADYFLRQYSKEERKGFLSFSQDVEAVLLAHPWEGNVRELQNMTRGIVVMHDGRDVLMPMLPAHMAKSTSFTANSLIKEGAKKLQTIEPLWMTERSAIESAIAHCAGNIPKAAALLEISPSTIYRKKMGWEQHGMGSPPIS